MKTGLIKMFRDVQLYLGRTVLTMAGVMIGITAVGAVLSAYTILSREMNRNFMDTNPASMIIYGGNFDANAAKVIENAFPQTDIEFRKTVLARIDNGNGTFSTIYLRAVENFNRLRVDTFSLEKGHFPDNDAEMALERDCFNILPAVDRDNYAQESLRIKLPGMGEKDFRIGGVVHAPGLAPASMEKFSYGFITLGALKRLGYPGWFDEIRIVCHNGRFNREKMRVASLEIKELLHKNGYTVSRIDVPVPGKHPHADQLDSLLFLLQAFTVIALLVACIIIINLLNFMMSKQSKQIAVMKAVGASSNDIAMPYFLYVLFISVAALLISIPLSIKGGSAYSDLAAYILNFNISSYAVPHWALIAQLFTAIVIPLASAAYPIYKSCNKSVRECLTESNDHETNPGRTGFFKTLFSGFYGKNVMPIANLTRKKTRTALAIMALAVGGILYMTSQNLVVSIDKTVAMNMKTFKWDYEITLAGNYPEERLQEALSGIRGLARREVWMVDTVHLQRADGADWANYKVKIMPDDTRMVKFETSRLSRFHNPMIITRLVADETPWLKPGIKVGAEIGNKRADVQIAGVISEIPSMPFLYLNRSTYAKLFGGAPRQLIVAGAATRDAAEQQQIKKVIEARLKAAGVEVSENVNIYLLRKAFVEHLRIVVSFLAIIAILAVLVGGLSIASAIGINITERKREIGVLRVVGADGHQIVFLISLEVFLMGVAGWFVGFLCSYPVSVWVGNYFGQIFIHADLNNTLSFTGCLQWLVISVITSLLSGMIPAWRAAAFPLREMLAYE